MSSSSERFARRLRTAERQARNANVLPRLPYSSIDGGSLELRDLEGNTAGYIGQQFDGTITSSAVGGSWPSRPSMVLVTAIPGGLALYWDGTYTDGSLTRMDFRRVTFHAVTDLEDLDILSPSQIVGEVTIATGGEVTAALPTEEHFVVAVVWTDAGKFSEPSDPAFGLPLRPVTSEEWQAHEDAIEELNTVTLPALVTDIADNVTAIEELNTVTLPALDVAVGEVTAVVDGWTTPGQTTIDGGQITTDSITALQIKAGEITTLKLAALAVTSAKIDAAAVTAAKIAAGAITAEKISADAVNATHIAAGAVTASELDVEVLRSGFTLTGSIQVGQHYWNPIEGLVIPQPNGGRIQLPADGSSAIFDGKARLDEATIRGNLNILGASNKVTGSVTLGAGVTEPTSAPSVYQSWSYVQSDHLDDAMSASYRLFTGASPHHSNTAAFMTCLNFGGVALRAISKTTGAYLGDITTGKPWVAGTYGYGVGYASSNYYVYLHDANRGGQFYIYKIDTSGNKVAEVLVNSDPYAHTGRIPTITADAGTGRVAVAYTVGDNVRIVQYDLALAYLGLNDLGGFAGVSNMSDLYLGAADLGAGAHFFIAVEESRTVYVFRHSDLLYQSQYNFPFAETSLLRGLWYDATTSRLMSYDRSGHVHTYSTWKSAQAFTASYTWYDGVGTTRETRESPASASWTLPARSYLNVETSVPPDSGITDPAQVDKANRAGVYVGVGAGARRLQSYLGVDATTGISVRRLTLDTVATGTATTPLANTFVGGAVSPGTIISGATSSGQPILEISGAGTIKAGPTTVTTLNGLTIGDTGWVNLPNTLATGAVRYRVKAGWVAVEIVAVAATTSGTTYTLVTAQIPAAYRPGRNKRGACDFSGFPGTALVNANGDVLVAHSSGANRAAIEGFVTYPVEVG